MCEPRASKNLFPLPNELVRSVQDLHACRSCSLQSVHGTQTSRDLACYGYVMLIRNEDNTILRYSKANFYRNKEVILWLESLSATRLERKLSPTAEKANGGPRARFRPQSAS